MLWSLMLMASLATGPQAPTADGNVMTLGAVRGVDASMRATIADGCRRSAVFADLVQAIARSTFIVYVEAVPALRYGMPGALLHSTNEAPYLRIHVKRDLTPDQQIAALAHELQHVQEVVRAGISANAAEMEMLYRRIGGSRLSAGRRQQFETAAALRAGDLVAADLRTNHDARRVGPCGAGARGSAPPVK